MKHISITILFCVIASFLFADDTYKVIKVNGQIVVKKTGKPLTQGDIFKESTSLQFQSDDAKATVINAEKGRFVISGNKNSKGNNLIPAINNVASRSGAIINIIDLQNQFSGNVCILDRLEIKIAGSDYAMSTTRFFYVEYLYKGEKIAKKLDYKGDTLILDRSKIFMVDGKPITGPDTPEMTIYYRNEDENKYTSISTFNGIFPETVVIKEEIGIILTEFKSKSAEQKTDEVMSYINEFYGKPVKSNVEDWIELNFTNPKK